MQLTSFGVCPGIFHKQPTSRSSEQKRTFSSSLESHQWWLFGRQEWFILHMPLSLDSCPTRLSPIFQHLKNREIYHSDVLHCHKYVSPCFLPTSHLFDTPTCWELERLPWSCNCPVERRWWEKCQSQSEMRFFLHCITVNNIFIQHSPLDFPCHWEIYTVSVPLWNKCMKYIISFVTIAETWIYMDRLATARLTSTRQTCNSWQGVIFTEKHFLITFEFKFTSSRKTCGPYCPQSSL